MVPNLAEIIFGTAWVLTAFERKTLLTCDHPLALWRHELDR
jgi:hypothetical protein